MESTTSIAASRQGAMRRQLGVIANNLANLGTNGYKSGHVMFVEHVVKSKGGERLISPKFTYTRDIASRVNYSDGAIETTGNPLDLAIRNEGFFVVRDQNGKEFYTRNGQFQLSPDGQLTTQQGHAVLAQGGNPINFAQNDVDVNISRDGVISTGAGQLGNLQIVTFENPQDLKRVSGALFTSENPATDVENPDVIQGALEGSNVEPITEIAKMIQLHRSYDSVKSFIEREDERQREMVRTLAREA